MKAIWSNQVLAESGETIVIEGNHYFPPDSIRSEFFHKAEHTSVCPWKGMSRYYDLEVDGDRNPAAAWYYPEPKDAAKEIAGYVAFWHGVTVEE
jgi:uncharacterized protein (DUF427 family)